MSKRAPPPSRRHVSRLALLAAALAAVIAVALGGAALFRRQALEPMPAFSLDASDREVASALNEVRQDVEQEPHSAEAWGDLGRVLRAHEFGPEAEVCFRNAQRLDPADYRWPYLLAVSLAATDQGRSLASLRQASDLAGDRLHVQLRLAEALLDQNELDQAAEVVAKALALAPEDARAQFVKARLLLAQGQLAESRKWCERSIAAAGDKRAPHLLMAQLCRRLGDAAGAERSMVQAASLPEGVTEWDDPDVAAMIALRRDPAWRLMSVDELAASGSAREAANLLTELAYGEDPSGEATARLVQALLEQGRIGDAEALLREKLAAHPDGERLRFRLGIVLFAEKKYEEAAAEFRRAAELKPDDALAHYNLGHALRKAGHDDEALAAFAATVGLSPSHAFARANLAELLLDAGNADEARVHLQVAARLAPRDPKVRELLARLPASPP